MVLRFKILGIPLAKQSARFYSKNGKIKSYQKKEVVDRGNNMSYDIISQLPKGFIPFDVPLAAKMLYVFPIPKTFSKKKIEKIKSGEIVYKETKPDLHDNLNKQTFDCMEGIVYTNDSRVCRIDRSEKIYGNIPRTEIEIYPIN